MSAHICEKFEAASTILGQRWVGLIINQLLIEPKRFSQLQSEVTVSGKVLSQRLKDLENEGIIKRIVYDEVPVRIEYQLTDKGKALEPVLKAIETWSQSWIK